MDIKIINKSSLPNPVYATPNSSGMDLCTNLNDFSINELSERKGFNVEINTSNNSITLEPFGRYLFPTGKYIELPVGYEAQIRPRSGLAIKRGLTVLNSPGTIDADYRGEIGIILVNLSNKYQTINHGDAIAQMIIAPSKQIKWEDTDTISDTERGDRGFGHTTVDKDIK